MITPEAIQRSFAFLLDRGFQALPDRSHGRVIRAEYAGRDWDIEVMYEPGDQYFDVIAYSKVAGQRSDYDDRSATMHLGDMRQKALDADRSAFLGVKTKFTAESGHLEPQLLKVAAETAASMDVLLMS